MQVFPNFSYIERILTGPGAHSPPLKSTLERYRLYTQTCQYLIDAQSKYLDAYLLHLVLCS